MRGVFTLVNDYCKIKNEDAIVELCIINSFINKVSYSI